MQVKTKTAFSHRVRFERLWPRQTGGPGARLWLLGRNVGADVKSKRGLAREGAESVAPSLDRGRGGPLICKIG